jgi:hypothetical protein
METITGNGFTEARRFDYGKVALVFHWACGLGSIGYCLAIV